MAPSWCHRGRGWGEKGEGKKWKGGLRERDVAWLINRITGKRMAVGSGRGWECALLRENRGEKETAFERINA